MILEEKQPGKLKEQDLQRLVDDGVKERDSIEYKSSMYGNTDDEKREMLKDVVSMANHRGGYLIVGMGSDSEGTATKLVSVEPGNYVKRIMDSSLDNIEKIIVAHPQVHNVTF